MKIFANIIIEKTTFRIPEDPSKRSQTLWKLWVERNSSGQICFCWHSEKGESKAVHISLILKPVIHLSLCMFCLWDQFCGHPQASSSFTVGPTSTAFFIKCLGALSPYWTRGYSHLNHNRTTHTGLCRHRFMTLLPTLLPPQTFQNPTTVEIWFYVKIDDTWIHHPNFISHHLQQVHVKCELWHIDK